MGSTVSIDTERLRAGASLLSADHADPQGVVIEAGELGSPRADAAFERFERYWSMGRAALTRSTDALATVLGSAEEAYRQRDAESARQFAVGGARAF